MANGATVKVGNKQNREVRSESLTVPVTEDADEDNGSSRKDRPEFDQHTAKDAGSVLIELDENGRMKNVPVNWTREFKGLRRADFSTNLVYNEHKLYLLDAAITKQQKRREELAADIDDIRKGGDPRNAKIKKVKKLADQFATMIAQLAEDGISVEDLGLSLSGVVTEA